MQWIEQRPDGTLMDHDLLCDGVDPSGLLIPAGFKLADWFQRRVAHPVVLPQAHVPLGAGSWDPPGRTCSGLPVADAVDRSAAKKTILALTAVAASARFRRLSTPSDGRGNSLPARISSRPAGTAANTAAATVSTVADKTADSVSRVADKTADAAASAGAYALQAAAANKAACGGQVGSRERPTPTSTTVAEATEKAATKVSTASDKAAEATRPRPSEAASKFSESVTELTEEVNQAEAEAKADDAKATRRQSPAEAEAKAGSPGRCGLRRCLRGASAARRRAGSASTASACPTAAAGGRLLQLRRPR